MVPPKAHLALLLSLLLGIVLHVAYLPSALDFYFDSHLVSGMPTHSVSSVAPTAEQSGEPLAPPAKRAVLFLVDGLRADALFERPARAPFIQSILRNTGAWGVSHVDAPTETRPKSISVLSGMQEDLSAIRTAWKSNPVPFDSLLNESQKAWAYGSPDVIPIFTEYLTSPSSVHSETYTLEFQETMHPNDLDQFVVDKVQGLFAQAGADKQSQLYKDLMQGRIVFLFHLLGTDSQGHANGGFSPAYLGHVSQVDQRVKHIVQTMDAFYQDDGKTTFALTSDHGMLRERHHDDPQIEVRRSPFVAWGAGIRGPLHDPGVGHDAFSQDWEYHDLARDDVRQVDISSLLASLIDIPIPLNSVGRVPLSYMSTSLAYKAHAMYANALQVWSQYRVKEAQVARQSLLFWPFRPAIDAEALFGLRASLQEEKYQDVVASSRIAVDEYLKGLQYYHTYHKNFWRLVISAGYVGWMVFILGQLSRMRNDSSELPGITSNKTAPNSVSVAVWNTLRWVLVGTLCVMLAATLHSGGTIRQCLYLALAAFLWLLAPKDPRPILDLFSHAGGWKSNVLMTLVVLELLVWTFHTRAVLSVLCMGMSLWPLRLPRRLRQEHITTVTAWTLTMLVLSVFPLLHAQKSLSHGPRNLAAVLALLALLSLGCTRTNSAPRWLLALQAICICLARLEHASEFTPARIAQLNRVLLAVAVVVPLLSARAKETSTVSYMFTMSMGAMPYFIMLSTSYEPLFYLAFCVAIVLWLVLHQHLHNERNSPTTLQLDLGPSQTTSNVAALLQFIVLLAVAFFGTEDLASLSPFKMPAAWSVVVRPNTTQRAILIVVRLVLPIVLLSCAAVSVGRSMFTRNPLALFCTAMAVADYITVRLFWSIITHGAWLTMGSSLVRYVIAGSIMPLLCLFFVLGSALLGLNSSPVRTRRSAP